MRNTVLTKVSAFDNTEPGIGCYKGCKPNYYHLIIKM